jgi:hypothetical protein
MLTSGNTRSRASPMYHERFPSDAASHSTATATPSASPRSRISHTAPSGTSSCSSEPPATVRNSFPVSMNTRCPSSCTPKVMPPKSPQSLSRSGTAACHPTTASRASRHQDIRVSEGSGMAGS